METPRGDRTTASEQSEPRTTESGRTRLSKFADRIGIDALRRVSWRHRWVGGTRPWQVSAAAYPRDGTLAEKAQFLLRYAVLAPSSHNTQPWLFTVADDEIRLFADLHRWLSVADPDRRELYVSLGAALENLLVAAAHFGVGHEVEYLPGSNPTHAATVRLAPESGEASENRDSELFEAIPRRRTTRDQYQQRPIPVEHLRALRATREEDDVRLQFVTDSETLEEMGDLTARADRRLFADPAYRRELGTWIGRGAFSDSWLSAKVGKLLVTYLNVGRKQAREDRRLIRNSPVVAVVRTRGEGRRAQIRAGQAFERASLRATALGIRTHPVSALLEVSSLRRELAERLGRPEWTPQHLFRLGYATGVPDPSPRRPVEAVLVD